MTATFKVDANKDEPRTDMRAGRALLWAIRDTINSASAQAARGSDLFDGTDLGVAFHELCVDLARATESDVFRRVSSLSFRETAGKKDKSYD